MLPPLYIKVSFKYCYRNNARFADSSEWISDRHAVQTNPSLGGGFASGVGDVPHGGLPFIANFSRAQHGIAADHTPEQLSNMDVTHVVCS